MKWIDINEALPKEEVEVLVLSDDYIQIGAYEDDTFRCREYIEIDATHWMPLPDTNIEKLND
jgi:hypothetical protein